MSDTEDIVQPLLPLATKTVRLQPGDIVPANDDAPYVVHYTMAALDPLAPADSKKTPSTLQLIRIEESEEDEDEEEDEIPEDTEPVTLLTLSPSSQFQQPIDLYIAPTEGVTFRVVGSYPIHLSGNIVDHPITQELIAAEEGEEDDEDDEDDEDEDEEEDDEDIPDAIDVEALDDEDDDDEEEEEDDDESESDVEVDSLDEIDDDGNETRIQEVVSEQKPKKRASEESTAQDKKKVKFSDALEKGPEASESKFHTKKLDGGVVIEDRTPGDGPSAKRGSRVSMRYVGKLANGKVFDKNTSGKPFTFSLGIGEVIRGWDIGIAGMKAGGERRIIIPAPMAYGKRSLPGIPKNSELRFDVKCLSIK